MSRVTDPNQVRLTGENSFITLHSGVGAPVTLKASHWRVLVSPIGPGHALFLKGDLTGDRARVYADNKALARWLQQEARQIGSDQDDPVIQATFTRSGDTTSVWTETVQSNDERVVLTWGDL